MNTAIIERSESPLALRTRLRDNGYAPIPANGKRATLPGWQEIGADVSDKTIRSWGASLGTNTGIVCGDVVAIDVDVSDPELVTSIVEMIWRQVPQGELAPVRVGRPPRLLFVFRAAESLRKRKTPKFAMPDGETAQVELLARGQQFIAFGTHPDTLKAYEWITRSPEDVHADELPTLSAEAVNSILQDCACLIEAAGGEAQGLGDTGAETRPMIVFEGRPEWLKNRPTGPTGPSPFTQGLEDREPLQRVQEVLSRINPEPRPTWVKVAGVLRDMIIEAEGTELGEDQRFDLYHRWSRGDFWAGGRPASYTGEEACQEIWDTLHSKGEKATFASLAYMAGSEPEAASSVDADKSRERIQPTPFRWVDRTKIPTRQWLYGNHLIRGFVSMTVSPGGIGKSTLLLAEAIAMASGKTILHDTPGLPLRVWYWNGEDPKDELQRRVAAICKHYNVSESDLGGRLFIDSGRNLPICIAEADPRAGTRVAEPTVEALAEAIQDHGIDVLIIDPFVSTHMVPESDNTMIETVARQWAKIADRTNCAVELVHHTRKSREEPSADDARGASALVNRARSVRMLSRMSAGDATEAQLEADQRGRYFRIDDAKQNLAPPASVARWCYLESVDLENGGLGVGDSVGVPTVWEHVVPKAEVSEADLDKIRVKVGTGEWRDNIQARDWVGKAIADVLGLDLGCESDKAKVKALQKEWKAKEWLKVYGATDGGGKARPCNGIGPKWPAAPPTPPVVAQG